MFFLIKLFFFLMALPVLLAFVFGASLFFRIRRNLQNPMTRPPVDSEATQNGGKIIEGEYKVLDD